MRDRVRWSRDENGVPHIEAHDLQALYWGMGHCHAEDRGLQLLLMRILGRGQGSEFLDASDEMLKIDTFFRRMNWHGQMESEVDGLSKEVRQICDSYCDGVNTFLKKSSPWELKLLGYKNPAPWTAEDCILLARMTGYLTLAQSQAEVERLLIEMVRGGVPRANLEELFPGHLSELDEELIRKLKLHESLVPGTLLWGSAAARMMASNNWVISGKKTASGSPILANDPHLETNRLPNVWCEQVLQIGERYFIGATMPGIPGPVVGRTNDVAWGATYTFMDAVDSWVEHCKDGKYLRGPDDWAKFRERREVIRRKKKDPVEVVFYENNHGTLDGTPAEEGYYLSTRWASANSGAQTLNHFYQMWAAKDVEDGMRILGKVETAWNWVLADQKGNIGYQMSGLMPRRRAGASGLVPLPGWKKENDWQGYVDPVDLPRALNPESGFLVTANEDLNHLGRAKPINMPMGPYRSQRITELLKGADRVTVKDIQKMHYDVYSIQAEKFMPILKPLLPDTEQGRILRDWDCQYTPESKGAFLFERVWRALLVEIFGKNGFGVEVTKHFLEETGFFADFYENFDRILFSEKSVWFGGQKRDEIFRRVAAEALQVPAQAWGEVQKVALSHILFGGKMPRFLGFDRGPVVIRGGRATVHQGQIYRSANRQTSFVPSFHMVTDLAEHASWTNLSGGPSDRRFSKWYVSDLQRWIRGEYKRVRPFGRAFNGGEK